VIRIDSIEMSLFFFQIALTFKFLVFTATRNAAYPGNGTIYSVVGREERNRIFACCETVKN
jgi:hypothetical protein